MEANISVLNKKKDGESIRINEMITSPVVRIIDENGDQAGTFDITVARKMAAAANLDLIEISPNAEPPVCKLIDYGKFRYKQQKRKSEQKKKQSFIEIKEIKLRSGISDNDYNTKIKKFRSFIDAGNKVKFTLRFRGREFYNQEIGKQLLERIKSECEEFAKIEQDYKLEGRQITIVFMPK